MKSAARRKAASTARRAALPGALAIAVALGAGGCGGRTATAGATPAAASHDAGCLPPAGASTIAGFRWSQRLVAARARPLASCLGVPAAQRPAFEAAAVRGALDMAWGSRAAQEAYFAMIMRLAGDDRDQGAGGAGP